MPNEHLESRCDNDNALIAVMRDYGVVIPAREAMQWRATKRNVGALNGLSGAATILCTNGVVAYFLLGDGRVLYGHVASFDGKVEPAFPRDPTKAFKGGLKERKERKTGGAEGHVKEPKRKRPTVTSDSIAAALAVLAAATAEQRSE